MEVLTTNKKNMRLSASFYHAHGVSSVTITPNGKQIISCDGKDNKNEIITLWDMENKKETRAFQEDSKNIKSAVVT